MDPQSGGRNRHRVACLVYQHKDASRPNRIRYIFSNEEVDIGRREVQSAWETEELTISTHHLRFRCIVFEEGNSKVAPLIYVRVLSRNAVTLKRPDSNNPGAQLVVGRESGDVLLNDEDVLQLTPLISLMFTSLMKNGQLLNVLDVTRQAEVHSFSREYRLSGRVLGAGVSGSVLVAVKQSNRRQVACKFVPIPDRIPGSPRLDGQLKPGEAIEHARCAAQRRESLTRECKILKAVDHPNIIRLEKVFCTSYNIYIFQELITAGDLMSYMEKVGAIDEPQTAVIMLQVLKAIDYLHDSGIAHRDIKPENILLTSWREGARIVLTDFGQARMFGAAKEVTKRPASSAVFRMQSAVGTIGYRAPELHALQDDQGYSKAIDLWSTGCITAILLTGQHIFPDDEDCHTDSQSSDEPSAADRYDLSILDNDTSWEFISRKAKSFIRGCLSLNETSRLTAKQALAHDWLTTRHYAAELAAVYSRATHDWRPRSSTTNLFEFVDTRSAVAAGLQAAAKQKAQEEIRSRYFPRLSAPKLPINAPPNSTTYIPRPRSKHTPLPSVADEAEDGETQLWVEEEAAEKRARFASPACIPSSPVRIRRNKEHGFEHLSITDLEPPETLMNASMPLPPPPEWTDSITPSQMLDEPSPPKYYSPLPTAYAMPTTIGKKRRASLADDDEIDDADAARDVPAFVTKAKKRPMWTRKDAVLR